jgi:hypothetical protein
MSLNTFEEPHRQISTDEQQVRAAHKTWLGESEKVAGGLDFVVVYHNGSSATNGKFWRNCKSDSFWPLQVMKLARPFFFWFKLNFLLITDHVATGDDQLIYLLPSVGDYFLFQLSTILPSARPLNDLKTDQATKV